MLTLFVAKGLGEYLHLNEAYFDFSLMAWETEIQFQVVIVKTQEIVLDTFLINTQHYKVRIKGKVKQSRDKSRALPYTSV